MKKLLSATLAFLFILGSVTFTPVTAPAEALNQSAYELIEEAVENLDDTVNISSCMVVYDQVHSSSPELSEILERLRNNRPDFFYFSYSVNFSVMSSDGGHTYYITNITLFYDMNKDDIPAAINYVNGKIDGIIDDIAYINELTQLQQALSVHDYLAVNFNYDYSLDNADVYSMLSEKVGVCQAFTGLYMMILKKLGITVSWSSSADMNHIWNLVKLDGNWYHVDTTWDDSSTTGRVYHYYFLQSDAAWADPLKEGIGNHYNWTDDYTCSDTAYDTYYWTNVISPIIFYDSNECYFIRYTGTSTIGMLMKHTDNSDSEMAHINDRWFVYESTTSYYPGCYSGLDAYGKYLYYNTPDTIYRFDTENNSSESIFHSDTLDGSIYGINVTPSAEGCIIQYEVAKSPDDTEGQIYYTTDNPECAFGHVYGDWEITTEPTETTTGVRTRTCSVCGGTEEEAVPLLSTENGYVYSVDTQPTGSTDGL
ncbi:MAG: transglutaminase domain-containing protein, partial [Eubacteriales bacterium]|nr:transglutaminase domain-containing protein [Eubacteriales bacterium]